MTCVDPWISVIREQFAKQKRAIESCACQLTDEELRRRPAPGFNSVATIARHIAGNLSSRFTDFLTTDGEKPTRDRESEFADWPGTREELMGYWSAGWRALFDTIDGLRGADLDGEVRIRDQSLSVRTALLRAVDHLAYHVGQVAYVSRLVHSGDWRWQTIAPGGSDTFNEAMRAR